MREKEGEAGDGWINIGPVDPDPTLQCQEFSSEMENEYLYLHLIIDDSIVLTYKW